MVPERKHVIRRGLEKCATPAGVVLVVALALVLGLFHSALGRALELGYNLYLPPVVRVPAYAMTVPVPWWAALVLVGLALLAALWLYVVTAQTLTRPDTGRIPPEVLAADVAVPMARTVVAFVAVGVVVAVGTALFVVPGVLAAAELGLALVVVPGDDVGVLEGVRRSRAAAAGHRRSLATGVVGVAVAVGGPFALASAVTLYSPAVEFVGGVVYGALALVVVVAAATEFTPQRTGTGRRRPSRSGRTSDSRAL